MNDLITIIIPVYNRQDVLSECIHSVLAQSCQNFEIFIIDDGSTDGTLDAARSLAASEPRITLLTQTHGGVSAARNAGLDAARGDYIFFLDSDDFIHPRLLESLAVCLKSGSADISATNVELIPEKDWENRSHLIRSASGAGEAELVPNLQAIHRMLQTASPLSCIGGVMLRRSLIGDIRFDPALTIGEDYWFLYQNLIKGADAAFLREKWYYARLHSGNSSWNWGFDGFWSRFLRRKLVWESEERLGRLENAAAQKRNAFSAFTGCLRHQAPGSTDSRQMIAVMKQHRSILLPALGFSGRLRFFASVYTPRLYMAAKRLRKKKKA